MLLRHHALRRQQCAPARACGACSRLRQQCEASAAQHLLPMPGAEGCIMYNARRQADLLLGPVPPVDTTRRPGWPGRPGHRPKLKTAVGCPGEAFYTVSRR